jgi:hypothetical protein
VLGSAAFIIDIAGAKLRSDLGSADGMAVSGALATGALVAENPKKSKNLSQKSWSRVFGGNKHGDKTILPTGLLTAIETVSSRAIPFPRIGARSAAARHMASESRPCLKSQPAKRWDTPPVGGQQGANEHGDSTRPAGYHRVLETILEILLAIRGHQGCFNYRPQLSGSRGHGIMDTSRSHRIPRNGNRPVHRMYKSGAFSQNTAAVSSR